MIYKQNQNLKILYEDNHLIAVNKPFNLLTQADKTKEASLYDIVKQYLKIKYQKPGQAFLGLLHRLDRPVAGIILFAKTSKAASRLSQQFRERTIKKTYLALVEGKMAIGKHKQLINYLLKNSQNNTVNIYDQAAKNSKKAILDYRVIKQTKNICNLFLCPSEYKNYSVLKINLDTGLSHQIRVQLSHIGHPIVGDIKYNATQPLPQKNIALMATNIVFQHPTTKEKISLEIPI